MARRAKGGVNKSEAIRGVFAASPGISVRDLIATLHGRGIKVKPNLVYLVKGNLRGEAPRRGRPPAAAAATPKNSDALATIMKVKKVAAEVGGLRTLKALIDALSE
jgi:hypothetical protein